VVRNDPRLERAQEDFMARLTLTFATILCVGAAVAACSSPGASADSAGAQSSADSTSAPRECAIDTITVNPGLLSDLKASVGDEFYKEYPGAYPHIEIPGAFDAALGTAEFGEWFYSVVGFNYQAEKLPPGSSATPQRVAVLTAGPEDDALLVTAKRNYAAAEAIFSSLTKVPEVVTSHTATGVKDTSWRKATRTSPAGRVECISTTYPDSKEIRPTVECTFHGVDHNMVQIYSTNDTGKCLAQR
jgi:hypothetical protein